MFQQFQIIPRDRSVPSYPGFTSFLSLSLFFFLRSFAAVCSVGNRRYVDHRGTYSEHNVIADIGRQRSRYTHLFSSWFPTSFSASARGLFTAEWKFARRPNIIPSATPSARSVIRSFVFPPSLRHRSSSVSSVRLCTTRPCCGTQTRRTCTPSRTRVHTYTHGKFGADLTKGPKN